MSKREQSELLLSTLVSRLSENGVMPEHISPGELFDVEPSQEQVQLFASLVDWLESEGIVRTMPPALLDGSVTVVLMAAGFQKLAQKLTNDLTLGAAINEMAKSRRPPNGLSGFGELLGGIAGGAIKSLGSG